MENKRRSEIPQQTHNLHIMPDFLPLIQNGQKSVEVRVAYPQILRVSLHDILKFNGQVSKEVTRIGNYDSFDEMYQHEDYRLIHPYAPLFQQLQFLHQIYPQDKEQLGIRTFELK